MIPQSYTDTWNWDEEPEIYGSDTAPEIANQPTGNVLIKVVTVASPDGYVVAIPTTSSPFDRAMIVQQLWASQGRPQA